MYGDVRVEYDGDEHKLSSPAVRRQILNDIGQVNLGRQHLIALNRGLHDHAAGWGIREKTGPGNEGTRGGQAFSGPPT